MDQSTDEKNKQALGRPLDPHEPASTGEQIERALGRPLETNELVHVRYIDDLSPAQIAVANDLAQCKKLVLCALYLNTVADLDANRASRFIDDLLCGRVADARMPPRLIRVVSGLLVKDGQVLMGLRGADKLRPNLWELPGGKVEDGESPQRALRREWHEELGVAISVSDFVASGFFQLEQTFQVDLYEVHTRNTPEPRDHQELRYVDIHDAVRRMPCSPGFYVHFPHIRAYLEANQ